MSFEHPVLTAVMALVVVAVGYWAVAHFFSDEAKWERRRRRSNAPIERKHRGPAIKLSVRTKKSKKR